MPTAPPQQTSGSRVLALDAVRGVAIVCVIATHSLTTTVASTESDSIPTVVFQAFDFGSFGVELFFLLSGWLIFSLYTGSRSYSPGVYWSRRWARIWPLWAVFLVLSYAFYNVPDTLIPIPVAMLLGLLFLGWLSPALVAIPQGGLTIQQEMGHYLLFSLFRKRSAAFLAGTVIVGYLSAMAAQVLLSRAGADSVLGWALEAWLRLRLFQSWPFFLLGGAAYVTWRAWRSSGVRELVPAKSWSAALILVALLLSMLQVYYRTPSYFVLGYVLLMIGAALMGNALPVIGPALRSIGRYSYFMYFFHFWVLRWIESTYRQLELPTGSATSQLYNTALLFVVLAFATALSWAAGYLSWRLFERPILDLVHRRVPTPRSTPTPAG